MPRPGETKEKEEVRLSAQDRTGGKPGSHRERPARDPGDQYGRHRERDREVGCSPGGDGGIEHPHRTGAPFMGRRRRGGRDPPRKVARRPHGRRPPPGRPRYTPSAGHDNQRWGPEITYSYGRPGRQTVPGSGACDSGGRRGRGLQGSRAYESRRRSPVAGGRSTSTRRRARRCTRRTGCPAAQERPGRPRA